MAKDIPRSVVKRMIKDYQRGALFSPTSNPSPSRDNIFWCYNNSNSAITAGKLVAITGFAGLSTYAQAYQAMLNNSLAFVVGLPGSGAEPTSLATTIDPISASSLNLGRIRYDGLTFVLAHINSDSHTEISAAGESVASDGACVIVAKSPKNSTTNYAVCAVAKKTGGGGGGGSYGTTQVLADTDVSLLLDGNVGVSAPIYQLELTNEGYLSISQKTLSIQQTKSKVYVLTNSSGSGSGT